MARAYPGRVITRLLAVTCAVGLGLATAGTVHAEPREPEHQQVITVRVASPDATRGILEAWDWSETTGGFVRVIGPLRAYVGKDGVGRASERVSRTPAGTFTLTEAFGTEADPGTRLPYVRVGLSDWWVSDVNSGKYNTLQHCTPGARCGFSQAQSEQLGAIDLYDHAIVIDYNREPVVKGAGSAFFLHVTEFAPTQGCVSITEPALERILRWLRPDRSPVISIGVGADAYAVLG